MPCDGSYLAPTRREQESLSVRSLLREVGLTPTGDDSGGYGNVAALDADIRDLCTWCRAHDVASHSLELQIWWRDHQIADAAKEERRRLEAKRLKDAETAKAKLTPDELEALRLLR